MPDFTKTKNAMTKQYKVLDALLIISIFAYSIVLIKSPFEVYFSYIPIFLLLPVFILKYGLPNTLIIILTPLLITGIISITQGENETGQLLKIIVGLLASASFYYYVIRHYNYNLRHLFKVYMYFSIAVGVIGLVQLLGYTLRIGPLYNLRWIFNKWAVTSGGLGIRVNSVFSEPSYYATTLAPAFFISLLNVFSRKTFFISKKWSYFMIFTYFLSFSSLGIIGVFLAGFFILIRFGYLFFAVLFLPLSIFSFTLAYTNIPEFQERFDSTVEVFSGEEFNSYTVHGSSFILFDNYQVARKNFSQNPFFGTGLGSHQFAFEKYSLTNDLLDVGLDGNSQDANSMFLRLMSETGLYGMLFILIFLFKNFLNIRTALNEEVWAMSVGCLLIILLYLFRQGHYFYNGFPFFLWMYYYLKKISKNPELYGYERE